MVVIEGPFGPYSSPYSRKNLTRWMKREPRRLRISMLKSEGGLKEPTPKPCNKLTSTRRRFIFS